MRRALVALTLVVAGLALAPGTPTAIASGEPTIGPLVAGESAYVDGVFTWTDYAYGPGSATTRRLACR